MSITICGQWKFRDDELSIKQFRKLSQQERDEYMRMICELEPSQRGTSDEYLLSLYPIYTLKDKNKNNFLNLND